jgi:DNA repair protein RadA/Sms
MSPAQPPNGRQSTLATNRSAVKRPAAPRLACAECGESVVRWVGRCPACQAWGTIAEDPVAVASASRITAGPIRAQALSIGDISIDNVQACPTGVPELDRVLGGGLIPGAVVLLAGEPGVGKSTLLLDVAAKAAATSLGPALLITGEESAAQIRLRAQRIGALHPQLFVAAENDLPALLSHLDAVSPKLLVVDSVQTITTPAVDGGAGSVSQIRAVTAALVAVAKERGIATVLVGHVTKDGGIAGPRALEHLVDVVLHFEGDRHSSLRLVRGIKNRYGAADELGCFEMREDGIIGVPDPSGLFLADRPRAVPGTCVAVTHEGRRALATEIQSLVSPNAHGGTPRRAVSDLDSSRVAMILAVLVRHGRINIGDSDVYTATVGGISVRDPGADLAIALAAASAAQETAIPATVCAIGEVSLSGDIRRVGGLDQRLAEAARLGFTIAMVPADSPARAIEGMRVVPVGHITDALRVLGTLRNRVSEPRLAGLRVVRS